jgi:hypothetical protein
MLSAASASGGPTMRSALCTNCVLIPLQDSKSIFFRKRSPLPYGQTKRSTNLSHSLALLQNLIRPNGGCHGSNFLHDKPGALCDNVCAKVIKASMTRRMRKSSGAIAPWTECSRHKSFRQSTEQRNPKQNAHHDSQRQPQPKGAKPCLAPARPNRRTIRAPLLLKASRLL